VRTRRSFSQGVPELASDIIGPLGWEVWRSQRLRVDDRYDFVV